MDDLISRKALIKSIKDSTAVRTVKVLAQVLVETAPAISTEPPRYGIPLTLEELRQMHGKPVWIEQENAWGIVNVAECGQWKDIPFVSFFYKSVWCDYNIEKRGLTCYSHESVKRGRWEKCENDGFEWYQCSICQNRPLNDHNKRPVLSDYCPNCGAKMDGGTDHASDSK